MTEQLDVSKCVTVSNGLHAIWKGKLFDQSANSMRSEKFALPVPFERIEANFFASPHPCIILQLSDHIPQELKFELRILGRRVGSYFDLTEVYDPMKIGAALTLDIDEFKTKWIQENGFLVVECLIIPKNSRMAKEQVRDKQLAKAFEEEQFTDFDLHCDGRTIKIAKAIVGPQSEFFRGLFETDMKESRNGRAEITNMSYQVLYLLIKFLYSGIIEGHLITREVLIAADYLNIANVNKFFEEYAAENICVENVNEVLLIAKEFEMHNLVEKCFVFLEKNNSWKVGYEKVLELLVSQMNIS